MSRAVNMQSAHMRKATRERLPNIRAHWGEEYNLSERI